MSKFMKNKSKLWILSCLLVIFSSLSTIGCSNSNYSAVPPFSPFNQHPIHGYPGHFDNTRGYGNTIFLSSDYMTIRGNQNYSQFLEEFMGICRNNRNTGFYIEWHHGGSFANPASSCDWASQNYKHFAVDLHIDTDPAYNPNVGMKFWVGSNGFHQSEPIWLSSMERDGEFRYQEEGFRIVYRPDRFQPDVVIVFNRSLGDITGHEGGSLDATIEYGNEIIGRGSFSVVH